VRAYRILPSHYLTPNRAGVRFWFSTHNLCRLSNDKRDRFGYDPKALEAQASELLDGIRYGSYQLAAYARTKRASRASLGVKGFLQDVRTGVGSGRGAHDARTRLKAGWNARRSRRHACELADIKNRYLLFPLNVPADAQLTLRTPHMVDLFSISPQIANCLPIGIDLVKPDALSRRREGGSLMQPRERGSMCLKRPICGIFCRRSVEASAEGL